MILTLTILSGLALLSALIAWEEFKKLKRSYDLCSWKFSNHPKQSPPWARRQPSVQTSKHLYTLLE
jgi:hypothetical protein